MARRTAEDFDRLVEAVKGHLTSHEPPMAEPLELSLWERAKKAAQEALDTGKAEIGPCLDDDTPERWRHLYPDSKAGLIAVPGGGDIVCRKCVKTRRHEIDAHNAIYEGKPGDKKDPDCPHQWVHPFNARWYCPKCGAHLNLMCGCGGSMYVCDAHHKGFIAKAIETEGSLENYLAKESW